MIPFRQEIPYRIDVFDTGGRRVGRFDQVPLLDVIRTRPDERDTIEGLLPSGVVDLGIGYRVQCWIGGALFAEATITRVEPEWGDTRKLILDKFVRFHEVIAFEAETELDEGNGTVSAAYINRSITQIVKDAVQRAPGPVHYTVAHTAYPDGAQREYQKFIARLGVEGALPIGGIDSGSWVDAPRIDATGVFAVDGDTIGGLIVDGIAWPHVRLMLIDAEETTFNAHAKSLHPETAGWTAAQYNASGYKVRADAAKDALQSLIDTKGVDFVELNPHKDEAGAFDDRVDAFGRYIGLVYGGGECFNAAQVENGHSAPTLFEDGAFLVPEMELKDFFSYDGIHVDSVDSTPDTLVSYDVSSGLHEVLATLGYAADGYVWTQSAAREIAFRDGAQIDRVVYFDPTEHAVALGADRGRIGNLIFFNGNPLAAPFGKTYANAASIDAYGTETRFLELFSVHLEEDADRIIEGMLDDIAYPEPAGRVEFLHGDAAIRVGDLIELRAGDLRRIDREVDGEWGGRFTGKLVGRIREIKHRLQGRRVTTRAYLGAPLRSVRDPLSLIVRSQPAAKTLFQFRLDDSEVGLDSGFGLD